MVLPYIHLRREHTRLTLGWALLGVSLAACGPGGGGAGADADTGMTADADAGFRVLPPNIDWLDAGVPPIAAPSFTPCPDGWREVGGGEEGNPVTCDPYPEGGAKECADGWAHFMGEPDCAPVGAPCPLGDFPVGLPADQPVLYVHAGASAGGDGTAGAPLATIGDAMTLASPGTVIALGKGTYDEAVYLAEGVTLWGACAAETRVTASSPGLTVRGVVQVFAAGTELRNVRIGPAELVGLALVGARADLTLEGVLIEHTAGIGFQVIDGGRAHGRALCVSDTRPNRTGAWGLGLLAGGGSRMELSRVLVSRNGDVGVVAQGAGTSVALTDLVVRDTHGRASDRVSGRGLTVQSGATAEVTRVLLERNRELAIYVSDLGTSATLTDLIVRDTLGQESDQTGGIGLNVHLGATAEVTRALLERNHDIGVFVSDLGTSATLTDLVVRDTQSQESDLAFGRGLNVQEGATAQINRALFERNHDIGVFVAGASASLIDLVVRDTLSEGSDRTGGRGLGLQFGATVEINRALFERNREAGLVVADLGTSATLTDIVVRDTQSRESDQTAGLGLVVFGGATAEVNRAVVERNRDNGVIVSDLGTSATLTDLVVRGTQSEESGGHRGLGLNVQYGATANATRALLARNHEFGVLVMGEDTAAQLTDIVVAATAEQRCATAACPEPRFGVGLASVVSAAVAATRFAVTDSSLCGVFLAETGELDLSEGQVSGSRIGVCLQVDDYAVARLTDGVRYVGNGTNLDSTNLPLPLLTEPIDPTP